MGAAPIVAISLSSIENIRPSMVVKITRVPEICGGSFNRYAVPLRRVSRDPGVGTAAGGLASASRRARKARIAVTAVKNMINSP